MFKTTDLDLLSILQISATLKLGVKNQQQQKT